MVAIISPHDDRPDVDEVAPEVVLEVLRVLDPEDEQIPHHDDGVQEDGQLFKNIKTNGRLKI
jgi:hypothetical protein